MKIGSQDFDPIFYDPQSLSLKRPQTLAAKPDLQKAMPRLLLSARFTLPTTLLQTFRLSDTY
ncbi:hypothetical protein GCWU000325_01940 [Alloprevotella tannerae ATCC 51259]|uniref:Uncharacterized protein n=1 Tax=Alloprevotella tannerae ATCC 51259 TaxID=626522 RepID=C9LI82_9BACT|nr:hypothetical protein GCWU000325_01940 [Alloprevotella tannerae ATCC 51259]